MSIQHPLSNVARWMSAMSLVAVLPAVGGSPVAVAGVSSREASDVRLPVIARVDDVDEAAGSAPIGGKLVFAASDRRGLEPWVSDGTAAGTRRLADLVPGVASSSPRGFTVFRGKVYFTAHRATTGDELWVTDGTRQGTRIVVDVEPGPPGSAPEDLTVAGDRLYFVARTPATGAELWTSNGTKRGTRQVVDLVPKSEGSYPSRLTAVGDRVVFAALGGPDGPVKPWSSDGTGSGTVRLDSFPAEVDLQVAEIASLGDRAVLAAGDARSGIELWATGTSAGTANGVKDIREGEEDGRPHSFTRIGRVAVFSARTESAGSELWVTDGSPGGTEMVRDILPAPDGSDPRTMVRVSGRVVFDMSLADDLWVTDGTTGGTRPVALPGPVASLAVLAPAGGRATFTGEWQDGRLYVGSTDGSATRTVLRADLGTDARASAVGVVGRTQLIAVEGTSGTRILAWRFGRPAKRVATSVAAAPTTFPPTPRLLAEASVFAPPGVPPAARLGRTLVFAATTDDGGTEPWVSDGTPRGTRQLADLNPGSADASPAGFVRVGDRVYFAAETEHGSELWRTDGTPAGTREVVDLVPGTDSSEPGDLTVVADRLFFSARDDTHGRELWVSDGTRGGTRRVTDLATGADDASPGGLTGVGDRLVFRASTDDGQVGGAQVSKPFVTDGTSAGTERLDVFPPATGLDVGEILRLGDRVVLAAGDLVSGREIWTSGTTAGSAYGIRDVRPGAVSSSPSGFTVAGGVALFAADDGTHGRELWQTDGTAGGTVLVRDIRQGPGSSSPRDMVAVRRRVVFTASDGGLRQVWASAGSAPSTRRLELPGAATDEDASVIGTAGGRAYAFATVAETGEARLWSTDGSQGGTVLTPRLSNDFLVKPTLAGALGSTVIVGADTSGGSGLFAWTSVPSRTRVTPRRSYDAADVRAGRARVQVRVTVAREPARGGTVVLRSSGRELGRAVLVDGVARVPLRPRLAPGRRYRVVASWSGTVDGQSSTSAPATIRISAR